MTDSNSGSPSPAPSYELVVTDVARPASARPRASAAETLRDEGGDVFGALWTGGPHIEMQIPGVATFNCRRGALRVNAAPEPGVSKAEVTGVFHKSVAPLLLCLAGHEVLHASAVRTDEGVVGFCAGAGTGKSTLAYGLGAHGFKVWADDALALDLRGRPRALRLPFDAWLDDESMSFFESASSRPNGPAEGETCPLAALAVVKRGADEGEAARIERLSAGRAFDEVVRHSYRAGLRADAARRQLLVENYMKLVASVPVFELRFAPGFARLASVLRAMSRWLRTEFSHAA